MIPPIIQQIDRTIETQTNHINQRTTGRFATVDTMARAASPPPSECTFDLETVTLQSALIDIAADTSGELARLGDELRKDEDESRVFLAEHRLNRRPPFDMIPVLGAWVVGAMLAESIGTTPAYSPYVGGPLAYATAALISLGVAVPAVLIGMGVVATRHRLHLGYRLTGFASVITGVGLMGFALLCGSHFRELVARTPRLITQPWKVKDEIIASISGNWASPLYDPPNWGLLGAGALASAITAWKVFNTFGYVGWRAIALREEDRRQAIVEAGKKARNMAAAAKKQEMRNVKMKATRFAINRRELMRASALNDAIVTSDRTAVKIVAKMRADAVGMALRSGREAASRVAPDWPVGSCPADRVSPVDRNAFRDAVRQALDQQDGAIATEPRALCVLSDLYRAFVANLQRAVESALGGQRSETTGGPVLTGPGGWRQ